MAGTTRRASGRAGRRLRPWRVALLAGLLLATAGLGACAGYVLNTVRTLPARVDAVQIEQSSFIYDRSCQPGAQDCEPVEQIHGSVNRVPVALGELPEYVPNAFIAIEDERFWRHAGVDVRGILRALWNNLRGGPIQGGSTITQQLARHLFPIGTERTLRRKLQEAVLAFELERRYPKEKILELYLNQIYFGRGAYGVEAAARTYFDKPARALTLDEAAFLAGVVNAPGLYNPGRNPEAALQRRNLVLGKMAQLGFITPGDADRAKEQPLEVVEARRPTDYRFPYFVDYVVQQLLDRFRAEFERQGYPRDEAEEQAAQLVYAGGLRIYTTLDPKVQQAAEEAVAQVMAEDFPVREGREPIQAALAAVEPATGEILALVGGREHDKMLGFNRAWQAYRQPGSAMKPLAVYAAALEAGFTAGTAVDDAPVSYRLPDGQSYFPRNFDDSFKGLMTIREALRVSVNSVAVRVLHDIGIDRGFEMAQRLGIDSLDASTEGDGRSDRTLSLALGGLTKGVTPLDMAQAYAVFASGGVRSEPFAIRAVLAPDGRVLLQERPRQEAVLSRQVAWVMTDILRNVIYPHRIPRAGTGSPARPADRRPAAGKTGTTTDKRDVWFVGYTPELSAAVWIGYDRPRPLPPGVWGGSHAGKIWKLTVDKALAGRPAQDFARPQGIVEATICSKDGQLAGPYCPPEFRYTEVFVAGSEPGVVGDIFKPFAVCAENPKLLYRPGCGCTPVERVFLDRPRVEPVQYEGKTYTVADMALAPPVESCTGTITTGKSDFAFQVRADDFEPRVVMGAVAGTEVRFTITALETDVVFRFDDLGLEQRIAAGETATVTFVPAEPGLYTFYFDTGRVMMPGRLVVQPAGGGQGPPWSGGGGGGAGGGEPAPPAPPPGDSGDGGGDRGGTGD